MRNDPLARLDRLAGMILDLRLADLRKAALDRQQSLDHLRSLEKPPAQDLPPIAAAQADLLYQRWADQRRAEINRLLARQTAEWLGAQDRARDAFGRAEALKGLLARKK